MQIDRYYIPKRLCFCQKRNQLDFVDAVYFLAQKARWEAKSPWASRVRITFTKTDLVKLIKGRQDSATLRKAIPELIQWALGETVKILEDPPDALEIDHLPHGRKQYTYDVVLDAQDQTIEKPAAYLTQGWIAVESSIHFRWMINYLLEYPQAKDGFSQQLVIRKFQKRILPYHGQVEVTQRYLDQALAALAEHRLIGLSDGSIDVRPLRARLNERPLQRPKPHQHATNRVRSRKIEFMFDHSVAQRASKSLVFDDRRILWQPIASASLSCTLHLRHERHDGACHLSLTNIQTNRTLWGEQRIDLPPGLRRLDAEWSITPVFHTRHGTIPQPEDIHVVARASQLGGRLVIRLYVYISYVAASSR